MALAEQRFMSSSHEWQFDNAWQEMLNHATIKVSYLSSSNPAFALRTKPSFWFREGLNLYIPEVFYILIYLDYTWYVFFFVQVMDAEKQKTDCNADHYRKADLFSAAELKVS